MDPDELRAAVDAALDAALGPVPGGLVEERPELEDPSAENEAMSHVHRAPSRMYGTGG